MRIEDLKNYAVSLFSTNHRATVDSVLDVLPIVMAKVPVAETEKIASYKFVESIGDGDGKHYSCLDISRQAIRANAVMTSFECDGTGKTIAILDSGINGSHPDLHDLNDDPSVYAPKIIDEISFVDGEDAMDTHGHGTLIAGIAAGMGKASNYQYVGVAPGAWLMNIKVARLQYNPLTGNPEDVGDVDDLIRGIDYAISRGADVILLARRVPGESKDGTNEVAKALDNAIEKGVVVVVAAGNAGSAEKTLAIPADAFNVITVGAVNDTGIIDVCDDTLPDFSSRGPTDDGRPKPDVVAPGVDIIASMSRSAASWQYYSRQRVGDFYYSGSGTSEAAAHVAGVVALMLQANPNLTPAQVKAVLRHTARLNTHLSGLDVNNRGHGIIDAYAAVGYAKSTDLLSTVGSQLYDSWKVTTPSRNNEKLNFTVAPPDWDFGISITDVLYDGPTVNYEWVHRLAIPHIWIDGMYYWLGAGLGYLSQYLFSGPCIYEKGDGYVNMRALYRVDGVIVESIWEMDVSGIWLRLFFRGGASWKTLMYIDVDAWDSTNYAYLPLSDETILKERRIWGDTFLDIRDLDHSEYVRIQPTIEDNPIMWVLKYDYRGTDPDSAITGEYIYNQNIIIYYRAISYIPDPGPIIHRKTNPPVTPDPTQNDARTGGDAGNTFDTATVINPDSYFGTLCTTDPVDTDDWYQFSLEINETIEVGLDSGPGRNFDVELYSPDDPNSPKAASRLPTGSYDSFSYTADSYGYWRVRIYINSGEGEYSFHVSVQSFGGWEPPPGEPIPERGDEV